MSTSEAGDGDAVGAGAGGGAGPSTAGFDWAATALGPADAWTESLKTAAALVLDSPAPMALLWGPEGLLIYNDGLAQMMDLASGRGQGGPARELCPEQAGLADQILAAGLAGRPLSQRNRGRRARQGHIWFDLQSSPVRDARGEPAGVLVVVVETTQRVLAEREAAGKPNRRRTRDPGRERLEAAAQDNTHLSAALAIARLGTFEWDYATQTFTFDARAREILGLGSAEPVTWEELTGCIDAEDMRRIQAGSAEAEAAGRTRREFEYDALMPDGAVRRVTVVTDLSQSQEGNRRFTGVLEDVTERRAAERRQRMLVNELNHRVKNTLATVQSIAAQTLRAAASAATAREDFESRLMALSAAHDLLTSRGWHGAAVADIAASAMRPFEARPQPQIRRAGPHVELSAGKTLALNLALHELATNAVKYGALSTPDGVVELSWTVRDDELSLRWVESGGPPVAPRAHAGFGARLLQRALMRELDGAVEWVFAVEGVRCEIRCRVEPLVAASPQEVAEATGRSFDF